MPIYKAPVEDVSFLLNDVFQIDRYDNLPGFSDASADVREAILGEAAKLSEEVLQPLNRTGDLEGCTRHDDSSVTTPNSSNPTDLVTAGGYVYFAANDGTDGVQLWRSDGTTAGTVMITDLNAANGGMSPTDIITANHGDTQWPAQLRAVAHS